MPLKLGYLHDWTKQMERMRLMNKFPAEIMMKAHNKPQPEQPPHFWRNWEPKSPEFEDVAAMCVVLNFEKSLLKKLKQPTCMCRLP